MHKNTVWVILLGIISVITIGFCTHAALLLFNFSRYDTPITAQQVTWKAIKLREDRYLVEGKYQYTVNKQVFTGSTRLTKERYRNAWAVNKKIDALNKQGPWRIWYNKKKPEHSTLQKTFPTKECISAAVLIGLTFYFLGLGYYVSRCNNS